MNIIVCIKSVPGLITGLSISQNGERLEPVVRSYCINETDEYAIDEALVLREKYGGQVTVISVGPASAEESLQAAVAKGADKALRIDIPATDSEITSMALAESISKMQYDLILAGLESSDNLASQVGIATAERLGIPFVFAATQIEIIPEGKTARVTRELGNACYQVLEIELPALIATQTGVQKLTYAPVAKLLQAKRRGIECLKTADLPLCQAALQHSRKWRYLEVFQTRRKHTVNYLGGTPEAIAAEVVNRIKESL